jgi:hypothetical protein
VGLDLLCALLNLFQERAEGGTTESSLPTWTLRFRDRIDDSCTHEHINPARIRLGLILRVVSVDADLT